MDDLQLNHTVSSPRAPGRGKRFFVIAVAIAAGLHLAVFGALALSAHNHQATAPAAPPLRPAPVVPAPDPAPAAAASSAASPATVQPAPVATTPAAAPVRHIRPLAHIPRGHGRPALAAKPVPVHKKPVKAAAKHTPPHAKAKPAAALDLNALSHFKPSGK